MMQKRKEKRGFVRKEKKMMSVWHKMWWRKQEGHSKQTFILVLHNTIITTLLADKALQDA
jgi:hypothetical protein